jgi:hypothetical protein
MKASMPRRTISDQSDGIAQGLAHTTDFVR